MGIAIVVALAVAVLIVPISAVFSVARSRIGIKVSALEGGSLSPVDAVFPLTVFPQLDDLVLHQPRGQMAVLHIDPGAVVSRGPEPVIAVIVVVASADEIDV